MTKHEAICAALEAAIRAQVLAQVGMGAVVMRGALLPVLIEELPGGVVNLAEGDTVEISRTLGVPSVLHQLTVEAECVVVGDTPAARNVTLDALLRAVGASVTDTTLGGLASHVIVGAPSGIQNTALEGRDDLKAAVVPLTVYYSTGPNPLAAI